MKAACYLPDGRITLAVWAGGMMLYEETFTDAITASSTGITHFHTDHLGSVIANSNETQAETGSALYSLYGHTLTATGILASSPWTFCGALGCSAESITGVVHMRARYYHPGIRRFVNADPIGFEGGMNWYGYANGDPVMRSDPSGNVTQEIYAQFQYSGVNMSAFSQGYFDARTGNGVASPEYHPSSYLAGISAFQAASYTAQGYSNLAASMNTATQLHIANSATEPRPGSGWDIPFAIMGGAGRLSGERVGGVTSVAYGRSGGTPASVLAGIQVISWGTSPPPGDCHRPLQNAPLVATSKCTTLETFEG